MKIGRKIISVKDFECSNRNYKQLQEKAMYKKIGLRITTMMIVLVLITSGCATDTTTKGTKGAVIGGAVGALAGQAIGRNTEGTLIGLAVGGLLGYIVGNEMDKYDQAKLNQVYESSPSNQRTEWVNPDTKRQYAVTPKPAYREPSGQICRDAEINAVIDGRPEKVLSTACRDANGRWVIQK
jgi:surface antigen